MSVVRNLLVRIGADLSGLRRDLGTAQRQIADFNRGVSKSIKGLMAGFAALGVGMGLKSAIDDAMRYEAALQQIDRTFGKSADSFKQWANENAIAFGIARTEAVQYGATFGNLIRTFTQDTREAAKRTQDLLEASAVISGATGRTMEDVMERIRSGMLGSTEAIEDLGVNVNVSMLESTEAFKKFANGKSWAQLSFQTQQQIRLFGILEQTASKYGTTVANNTASNVGTFVAQLKDVRLGLGQAFLPIINFVLPSLTKLAAALANATRQLAAFMYALFGYEQPTAKGIENQTSAVSGLGDELDKTGKKAKKAQKSVAGFDQVNLIGGNSESGSGDAGAAAAGGIAGNLDIEPELKTDKMESQAQAMAKKVKAAFETIRATIKSLGAYLAKAFGSPLMSAWSEISPVLERWKGTFAKVFKDVVSLGEPLKQWFLTGLVPVIQQNIALIGHIWAGLLDSARMVFENLWEAVFPILEKFVRDGLPRISDFASGMISIFRQAFDVTKEIFDDIWQDAAAPALFMLSKITQDTLDILFGWWDKWGRKLIDGISQTIEKLKDIWRNLWDVFLKPFITDMLDNLTWLWDKHLKGLVKEVGEFVGKLISAVQDILNKFVLPIINYLVQKLGPGFRDAFIFIGDVISTIIGVIADVANGIFKALGGIVDFIAGVFTGDWKRAWEGVKDVFKGIFEAVIGIFKGAINLIIDSLNYLIRQMNKIQVDVPDWVPGWAGGGESFGINIKEIPKLAKGGLAFGPTLAMVGDNRGAASDPEVVAPLSRLEGMISSGNDNKEVVRVLNAILQAVKQSGPNDQVAIRKSDLARAAISGQNDLTRRAGRTLAIT